MRIIHVLRKPLSEGTVAANTLKHGTGGINVDVSRIASPGEVIETHSRSPEASAKKNRPVYGEYGPLETHQTEGQKLGRWPANVILQHLDGCRCDGVKRVKGSSCRSDHIGKGREGDHTNGIYGAKASKITTAYVGSDGKESVANWICAPGCPVAGLDEQSGVSSSQVGRPRGSQRPGVGWGMTATGAEYADTGGASRFFKQVGGKSDG